MQESKSTIVETSKTEIIFENQPKLSEHEVNRKYNERRLAFIPQIRKFISEHPLFIDKQIKVRFAEKGVSSLVSIIETPENKFVLKIPLSLRDNLGEAMFLKKWAEAGVKVPAVFASGKINEHEYTLMEYVDAPTLASVISSGEMIMNEKFFEMGKILKKMHSVKSEGFGKVADEKAEHITFKEWVKSPGMKKKIKYIQEHNLFEGVEDLWKKAKNILIEFVGEGPESSYCHNDFGAHNIFATEPMTVFDPSPRFNHGYIDLGRAVQSLIGADLDFSHLVDGYFDGEQDKDPRALNAAIVLNILSKLRYAHETKQFKRIENLKKFLDNAKLE